MSKVKPIQIEPEYIEMKKSQEVMKIRRTKRRKRTDMAEETGVCGATAATFSFINETMTDALPLVVLCDPVSNSVNSSVSGPIFGPVTPV